jgi:hypothetical protein
MIPLIPLVVLAVAFGPTWLAQASIALLLVSTVLAVGIFVYAVATGRIAGNR